MVRSNYNGAKMSVGPIGNNTSPREAGVVIYIYTYT